MAKETLTFVGSRSGSLEVSPPEHMQYFVHSPDQYFSVETVDLHEGRSPLCTDAHEHPMALHDSVMSSLYLGLHLTSNPAQVQLLALHYLVF